MKKLFYVIINLLIISALTAQEINRLPIVGITAPYMSNDNTFTEFFNRQFSFEFFSNDTVGYEFDIIHTEFDDNTNISMENYFKECKDVAYSQDYDYLIVSRVYTLDEEIFTYNFAHQSNLIFKYDLINLAQDKIIISNIYNLDDSYTLNEILSFISKKILFDLNNITLEVSQSETKKNLPDKNKEKDESPEEKQAQQYEENQKPKKHEIFVQNGFLKVSPRMMSFLSYNIGYSFIPYKFFDLGGSIFLGGGSIEDKFDFQSINFNQFYFGTSTGINFFLPGFVVEPSIGVKVELSYIINYNSLDLYIPIDMGLKFNLNKHNYLKINFDFQFTTFNIFENQWQNNYLISVWIGYAKKI